MLSNFLRQIWRRIPLGIATKQRLQTWAFKALPWIFRHTVAYRGWKGLDVDLSEYSLDEAVIRFGKMIIRLTGSWR